MTGRGLALVVALVAVVCAGCAASVGGQGTFAAGSADTAAVTEPTAATGTGAPSTTIVTSTATATATVTSPPATSTATPPATAAPPAGGLEDQGWVVVSTSFTSTFGIFFGSAEITNTAATPRSGIFTFTLSKAGTTVSTLIGSADATPAGQNATVELFGGDPFVEGPYDVAFAVSFTY